MSQTANQWTLFPYNNRHCKVECAISCFHSLGLYSNRFERPHQFLFACTLKQCFTTILPWTKWNHRNREAAAVSNCSNYISNTMKQSTQRHQSFYFHRLSADAEKARLHTSNFKQQNRTHIDAQITISIRILLNKLSDFRVSANTKGMNTQLRTLHFLLLFSSISSIHYDLFY